MSEKTAVIIPARYGSTRFPGKILASLGGKPVLQWVYENALRSGVDRVVIATDDEKVMAAAAAFGAESVMTSSEHCSGTDRVHEAAGSLDADIIVNVQGDEPFVPPEVIAELVKVMSDRPELEMATVAIPEAREKIGENQNIVKVVFDNNGFAFYFSRAPIPFLRRDGKEGGMYHHWGIYAYRRNILDQFVSLPPGRLEQCEMLEQLRALENGIRIYVMISQEKVIGIDTPEDLAAAEKYLSQRK